MGGRLIRPSPEYLDSYLEACQEFKASGNIYASLDDPDDFQRWKTTIFQDMADQERGIGLPEGYVPHSTFWLVDGFEYVGTGHIRHSLTESLKWFGGHIGYVIRPSRWNMGYGTLQLGLLLKEACALGIDPALMTCDLANPASQKVMEKNGATLIDIKERVIDGKKRMICRYQASTCRTVDVPRISL